MESLATKIFAMAAIGLGLLIMVAAGEILVWAVLDITINLVETWGRL